jgi:hypothetical protein
MYLAPNLVVLELEVGRSILLQVNGSDTDHTIQRATHRERVRYYR